MKAVGNLRNAETIGTKNFQEFVDDRIKNKKKSVFDTIKQNKLWIFNQPAERSIGKKDELTTLKKSCYLFSQQYIVCRVRDGNLDEFLSTKIRHSHHLYRNMVSYDQVPSQISLVVFLSRFLSLQLLIKLIGSFWMVLQLSTC